MTDHASRNCPPVRYRISEDDRLIELNEGWSAFARANGGDVLGTLLIGRRIWDFISDLTTIQLYQSMVQRVRQTGIPARFCFRCDAPARRRLLSMDISRAGTGPVQFAVDSVREEGRPAVLLLDVTSPRGDYMLTVCGWCARVRLSDVRWVEVDVALRESGLLAASPLPRLTHGICSMCAEQLIAGLDDSASATAGSITLGAF